MTGIWRRRRRSCASRRKIRGCRVRRAGRGCAGALRSCVQQIARHSSNRRATSRGGHALTEHEPRKPVEVRLLNARRTLLELFDGCVEGLSRCIGGHPLALLLDSRDEVIYLGSNEAEPFLRRTVAHAWPPAADDTASRYGSSPSFFRRAGNRGSERNGSIRGSTL